MKFKKQMINIRVYSETDPAGELKQVEVIGLGDWCFRKESNNVNIIKGSKIVTSYGITHIPSGLLAICVNKEKTARNACIAFESCPAKWNGKGDAPKEFNDQIGTIAKDVSYGRI